MISLLSKITRIGLVMLCATQIAGAAAIRSGLVGYWPFDEQAGLLTADRSGVGQSGELINFANDNKHWVTGQIGGAIEFGGNVARQYVRVASFVRSITNMSVSAWVYADTYSPWSTVARNFRNGIGQFTLLTYISGETLSIYYAQRTDVRGVISIDHVADTTPLTLRTWHHVGFVADGSDVKIWLDGAFVVRGGYDGTLYPFLEITAFEIGGGEEFPNTLAYWDGKIDDVGLWTRALSSEEMGAIYAAGLAGRPLGSVNFPPMISPILNVTLAEDAAPVRIPFTILDVETAQAFLQPQLSSSNPGVVGATNMVVSGTTSNRVLTLSLVPDGHGTTDITITVTDRQGASTNRQFTVVVTPVNDRPVAESRSLAISEDSSAVIELGAFDADFDPLTFSPASPAFGSIISSNGVVYYTPPRDFFGTDQFSFTVSDGVLESQPATITINVTAVNDAPMARAALYPLFVPPFALPNLLVLSSNGSNATVILDASASTDVDNSLLQYSWLSSPDAEPFASGALATNVFEVGTHVATLVVSDGDLSSTASLPFEVITCADAINVIVLAVNESRLPRRGQRPLIVTLKAAMAALDTGRISIARHELETFLNKIDAQLAPTEPALVEDLTISIRQILNALER